MPSAAARKKRSAAPRRKPDPFPAELTSIERQLIIILTSALERLKSPRVRARVLAALENGDIAGAIAAMPWASFEAAMTRAENSIIAGMQFGGLQEFGDFDPLHYRSILQARMQAANLVVAVSGPIRKALRDTVIDGLVRGQLPNQIADRLRSIVGLDPRFARAVSNFAAGLQKRGASPQFIAKSTDRYRRRLHTHRVRRIARTELAFAANRGRQQAWEQAIEKGILPPTVKKKWLTGPNPCERCKAMADKSVGMDDEFILGGMKSGVTVPNPPLHPHCGCILVLDLGYDYGDIDELRGWSVDKVAKHLTENHGPLDQWKHGRRNGGAAVTTSPDLDRLNERYRLMEALSPDDDNTTFRPDGLDRYRERQMRQAEEAYASGQEKRSRRIKEVSLTNDSGFALFDELEAKMGMRRKPEEEHPERYAPNPGYGVHLKRGEIETRTEIGPNREPIEYDVTSIDPAEYHANPDKYQLIPAGMSKSGFKVRVPGSERLVPHTFRTMSEDEWQGALERGYIQSDQRMNLDNEGTVSSDTGTGSFYMVPGPNRIVRIRVRPEERWWREDADRYIKTFERIPIEQVDLISPVLNYVVDGYRRTVTAQKGSVIAKHGNKGDPGYRLLHPGTGLDSSRTRIRAQVGEWEKTKPWDADKKDFEYQSIPGLIYRSRRHAAETASYLPDGRIAVHDDWFALPSESRRAVLYHEAGHGLETEAANQLDDPISISDIPGAKLLGHNYSEVLAEAYSVIWTEPEWLDERSPEIRDLIIELARRADYPLPPNVRKHYGPGLHRTGSPQLIHGVRGKLRSLLDRFYGDPDYSITGLRYDLPSAEPEERAAMLTQVEKIIGMRLDGISSNNASGLSITAADLNEAREAGVSPRQIETWLDSLNPVELRTLGGSLRIRGFRPELETSLLTEYRKYGGAPELTPEQIQARKRFYAMDFFEREAFREQWQRNSYYSEKGSSASFTQYAVEKLNIYIENREAQNWLNAQGSDAIYVVGRLHNYQKSWSDSDRFATMQELVRRVHYMEKDDKDHNWKQRAEAMKWWDSSASLKQREAIADELWASGDRHDHRKFEKLVAQHKVSADPGKSNLEWWGLLDEGQKKFVRGEYEAAGMSAAGSGRPKSSFAEFVTQFRNDPARASALPPRSDPEDLRLFLKQKEWNKLRVRRRTANDIIEQMENDPALQQWVDDRLAVEVEKWEESARGRWWSDLPEDERTAALEAHSMLGKRSEDDLDDFIRDRFRESPGYEAEVEREVTQRMLDEWFAQTSSYQSESNDPQDQILPDDPRHAMINIWVNAVDNSWVGTAFDESTNSIALQWAIAENFNSPRDRFNMTDQAVIRGRNKYEDNKVFYDAWVGNVYWRTQTELAAAGFDNVELYRGMNWPGGNNPDHVYQASFFGSNGMLADHLPNPGSSWSGDDHSAEMFGGNGAMYATRLPRRQIFATSITGLGSYEENEVIAVFPDRARSRTWTYQMWHDMKARWAVSDGMHGTFTHGIFETGDEHLHPPGWYLWNDEQKAKWYYWQRRDIEWWPGKVILREGSEIRPAGEWFDELPLSQQEEIRDDWEAQKAGPGHISWDEYLHWERRYRTTVENPEVQRNADDYWEQTNKYAAERGERSKLKILQSLFKQRTGQDPKGERYERFLLNLFMSPGL